MCKEKSRAFLMCARRTNSHGDLNMRLMRLPCPRSTEAAAPAEKPGRRPALVINVVEVTSLHTALVLYIHLRLQDSLLHITAGLKLSQYTTVIERNTISAKAISLLYKLHLAL